MEHFNKVFTKNDWDHFHDVVYEATGNISTREQLRALFDTLPEGIQKEAYRWGMSDTPWREDAFAYLSKK